MQAIEPNMEMTQTAARMQHQHCKDPLLGSIKTSEADVSENAKFKAGMLPLAFTNFLVDTLQEMWHFLRSTRQG